MKKSKIIGRFAAAIAVCCLAVSLAACGKSADPADFTAKAAGVWHRHGNLQDEKLEVLKDGKWTRQELEDGEWKTVSQGTVGVYDEENKGFRFVEDKNANKNSKIYLVNFTDSKNTVLRLSYDYYRVEDSVDGFGGFNGKWYLNADKDKHYYAFEDGRWKFFEAQGMGHVSVDSGYLVGDGVNKKLLARKYPNTKPFAEFDLSQDGKLLLGKDAYELVEDSDEDEDS
jgi:hypothetical protein